MKALTIEFLILASFIAICQSSCKKTDRASKNDESNEVQSIRAKTDQLKIEIAALQANLLSTEHAPNIRKSIMALHKDGDTPADLDQWGREYKITLRYYMSDTRCDISVTSAGPDGVFNTADDIRVTAYWELTPPLGNAVHPKWIFRAIVDPK